MIAFALALSFTFLLVAIQKEIPIILPLLAGLGLMAGVYRHRGTGWRRLLALMAQGVRQSTGVLSILLLIGLVVASWLMAGTVPALVYYGLKLIHPQWFLVSAFVLTALVSALLGTSFGSAGTIGLALMIMARGAGVHEHWAAGAIMAGVYVGDRCSPMSSSAHLIAAITGTDIYRNLQNMMLTSWGALVLSLVVYMLASRQHPLSGKKAALLEAIPEQFAIHPIVLLPAGILIVLSLMKLPVKRTLLASLLSAIVLALSLQAQAFADVLQTLLWGLHLPNTNPLSAMFQGGGLWSMIKVCGVVLTSTALAGLLSGMGTFDYLGRWLSQWPGPRGLFGSTVLASTLTSAFGCTQTIAILLTQQIAQPLYTATNTNQEQLAVDIENSAVVLAPLIPWNIAGLVPATVLLTDARFIPYAVYLYLLPLLNWLFRQSSPKLPASQNALDI